MLILGIESSCDDTAASVIKGPDFLLSSVLSGQDDIHTRFGGVVPELASRQHLKSIQPMVDQALVDAGVTIDQIDLIAVTQGPGLIGSLLVGFSYAKALGYQMGIPCVGVDHMTGHILSVFLEKNKPSFPYVALIVSGGTTSLFSAKSFTDFTLLGRTRDDAAGEAFDKVAKILGLPYPGGPHISKLSKNGKKDSISFPRSLLEKDSLDFSFSGLKTAVMNYVHNCRQKNFEVIKEDVAASFQEAVCDVLVQKTLLASEQQGISTIVLGGGVSANPRLRYLMGQACNKRSLQLYLPSHHFCTDNAAMIAVSGYHKYNGENMLGLNDDVFSRSFLG